MRPSIDAPTEVFVPPVEYPNGYRVTVTGPAEVVSAPNATQLELQTTGPGTVDLTLNAS